MDFVVRHILVATGVLLGCLRKEVLISTWYGSYSACATNFGICVLFSLLLPPLIFFFFLIEYHMHAFCWD